MRVIVRRDRTHPGAQLDVFEERDGYRYQAFATRPARRLTGRPRPHPRTATAPPAPTTRPRRPRLRRRVTNYTLSRTLPAENNRSASGRFVKHRNAIADSVLEC